MKTKTINYKYRSVCGKHMANTHEYTGDKDLAIQKLRNMFVGSMTPIVEIEGKRVNSQMRFKHNQKALETSVYSDENRYGALNQ